MLDSRTRMEFQVPLRAFYSYAHKHGRDRRHLDELLVALARSRKRDNLIDDWDDRKIRAGQQWEQVIIERAHQSRVFALIITNRFIDSDFCVGTELTIARRLFENRAAAIAPILAEDADWEIQELQDLHVIMPFGKPVSRSKRAEAWPEVGKAVRQMAEDFSEGRYFANLPSNLPAIPSLLPFAIGRDTATATLENELRAAPRHRPFICVLTGEKEGQSEFIENLLIEDGPIRKTLNLSAAHNPVAIEANVWLQPDESVESSLNVFLASQVMPEPLSADCEGIAASLADHPGLSVVHCELSAAEWRDCGDSRLQQLLRYWDGWPNLKPDHSMIVFVSIRANTGPVVVPGGICLQLLSVTPEAVRLWLTSPLASRRFIVDRLRAHLDKVFGPKDRLPMEEFASRFLPHLRKFQICI